MRILLTVDPEIPVPPLLYGGIERIAASLVETLVSLGHEVALAAHPDSTAPAHERYSWPGPWSRSKSDTLRNAMALWKAVRQFRPDVVHSFSRLWYLAPILRSRLPKIMSYQREPSLKTVRQAEWLAGDSLRFTGCSEYICRQGRPAGGTWTAIHNFVDVDRFTFVPAVAPDAPLVFLSRIESIKGPHLAIESAKRTHRRLIIAGNHSATPAEADYWRNRIEPELGTNGIEYIGPVNDEQKNKLLGQAAALIVPIQWNEPFGIVFAEALACGTPVISSPRGALPEIVDEGVTGSLVDGIDDLVSAISQVDRLDRTACRQAVVDRFSSKVVCRRYENAYQSMTLQAPR